MTERSEVFTQVTPIKTKICGTKITPNKPILHKAKQTQVGTYQPSTSTMTAPPTRNQHTQINLAPLDIQLICHSDKETRRYTGLNYDIFKVLHTYLVTICDDENCQKTLCKEDPKKQNSHFYPQRINCS